MARLAEDFSLPTLFFLLAAPEQRFSPIGPSGGFVLKPTIFGLLPSLFEEFFFLSGIEGRLRSIFFYPFGFPFLSVIALTDGPGCAQIFPPLSFRREPPYAA